MKWTSECAQSIDFFGNLRIFYERRGVMGFEASVDDEGAGATPVFVFGEAIHTVDIVGGVGSREGDPKEVVEMTGCKIAVVNNEDERETIEGLMCEDFGEAIHVCGVVVCEGRPFNRHQAGQNEVGIFEMIG